MLVCDHHCLWVNNCMGHNNYCWFIAYLVTNIWFMSYGFYLTYYVLSEKVAETGLAGSRISQWQQVALSDPLKSTTCLMLLAGIMVWLVVVFLIQHLYYMYLGVTTNECAKWEDVQYCVEEGTVYMYYNGDGSVSEHNIVVQKEESGRFNRLLTSREQDIIRSAQLELKKCTKIDDITNIYDRGFRKNLIDRIFTRPI